MSATNDHQISVLNGLIETTLDSSEGYREAAQHAKTPAFKSLFEIRAMQRKQIAAELKSAVRSLGGEPEDDGTILGVAHRVFLDLKNKMSGNDKSVIDEVEAGEDHIKAKFEDALEDTSLSSPIQKIISDLYITIKADHDEARDLKHSMHHS